MAASQHEQRIRERPKHIAVTPVAKPHVIAKTCLHWWPVRRKDAKVVWDRIFTILALDSAVLLVNT